MIPQFEIGARFIRQGYNNHKGVETVTDILITKNQSGCTVKIRYAATHDFIGQTVTDYDVIGTTIARGLIR